MKLYWNRQINDELFADSFAPETRHSIAWMEPLKKIYEWNHHEWHFYFNSIFAHVFPNTHSVQLENDCNLLKILISTRMHTHPAWEMALGNHRLCQMEKLNKYCHFVLNSQMKVCAECGASSATNWIEKTSSFIDWN